ncbi:MAG TPA: NusG domain II-containing protein [Candidatus Bipolaricaulota bacterium]
MLRSAKGFGATARSLLQQLSWGDWVLVTGVLALCAGFFPWLQSGQSGQAAVVYLENQVVATLPLARETEYAVWGPLGRTVLQVQGGKLRVISDPGPQQLCVLQGWISRQGETLVCLPNRVVIQIPGTPPYDSLVK